MTFFALAIIILIVFAVTVGFSHSNNGASAGKIALVCVATALGCFLLSAILWNTRRSASPAETATATRAPDETGDVAIVATMNAEHAMTLGAGANPTPTAGTEVRALPRGLTNEDLGEPRPSQEAITPPPSWLEPRRIDESDTTLLVLSSQRWATREEALQDLRKLLVETLKRDFDEHQKEAFTPWRLAVSQAEVAVREPAYVESYRQDLGTYVAVMYRAHMQVELSPSVRAKLRPIWRGQVVEVRLWGIGSLVAAVTLVFGMIALGLRLLPLVTGFQRFAVVVACLLVSVIGGSTLIYWARSGQDVSPPVESAEGLTSGDMASDTVSQPSVPPPVRKPNSVPATPVAARPVEFFGVSTGTKRVAIVVEDSESMLGSGASEMVQAELIRWCESTAKTPPEFIVVSYGETVDSSQLTTECSKGTAFLESLDGPTIKNSDKLIEAIEQALVVKPDHIIILRDASDPKFGMPDTAPIESLRASTSINHVEILPTDDFARPLNEQPLHALPFKVDAYKSVENSETTEG